MTASLTADHGPGTIYLQEMLPALAANDISDHSAGNPVLEGEFFLEDTALRPVSAHSEHQVIGQLRRVHARTVRMPTPPDLIRLISGRSSVVQVRSRAARLVIARMANVPGWLAASRQQIRQTMRAGCPATPPPILVPYPPGKQPVTLLMAASSPLPALPRTITYEAEEARYV
jgi:hypothetical protein